MRISVVMPAYNAAPYIGAAIQSLLAQSFTAWELVVVDDNSRDDTAAVVASFQDPRIRYFKSEVQLRAAGARNKGTQEARFETLCYFDADDRLLPNALEVLWNTLQNNPDYGLVYGNYVRIDEHGHRFGARHFLSKVKRPSGDVLRDFLIQNRMVNGGLALVKKAIIEAVGGWNTTLKSNEDWALWVLVAAQTKFLYIPDFIALEYRELPTGVTQTINNNYESRLPAVNLVYSHPLVTARFAPDVLAQLRRASEAHSYAMIATQMVRKKQWSPSLSLLLRAYQKDPRRMVRNSLKYALAVADVLVLSRNKK